MLRNPTLVLSLFFALTESAVICRAAALDSDASGHIKSYQAAVLNVHRDFFGRGHWEFTSKRPGEPAEARLDLTLPISDLPDGSVVTGASLDWQFSNWSVQTAGASYGNDLPGGARRPQCLGIGCRAAVIQRFESFAIYNAISASLNGSGYAIPEAWQTAPNGSLDLLSIWSADALDDGGAASFSATVRYDVGRPFFDTEGRNANTQFDVTGWADLDVSAHLRITYTEPPPPPPPVEDTPEPASMFLSLTGGAGLLLWHRRKQFLP